MPELTAQDRAFLRFALDVAFDRMVSDEGFTEEDWASHEKLKKITEGQDA